MNIVLTGMMGSGKSTVGRELAGRLDFHYIDTDKMIEKQVGKSINDIFEKVGEISFRKLEKEAARCVSVLDNFIISTGGGVVKYKENLKELKENSALIYLYAPPEILYERLKKKKDRPLLKVPDPLKKLKNILKDRKSAYNKADITIDTAGKKPSAVAKEIIEKVADLREA
ncbi:MAG: shikimate kinase [Elusimicrobia bacterium]|nr:shikimate kinase [Elusimicrobiota bacterium]